MPIWGWILIGICLLLVLVEVDGRTSLSWQWLFFKASKDDPWKKKRVYKQPDPDYFPKYEGDERRAELLGRGLGYAFFWVEEVDKK